MHGYAWVTDSGSLVLFGGNGASDWATDTDNGAEGSTDLCDSWDHNLS